MAFNDAALERALRAETKGWLASQADMLAEDWMLCE